MSRIASIPYEQADGELKSIYDDLIHKRGRLSAVLMIQSLSPATIKSHTQLYLDIMFAQSPLTRIEREVIATVVSVANRCHYCQIHHSTALNNYWKDDIRVQKLLENYRAADLSEKELIICNYAIHLTKNPGEHESTNFTEQLKKVGCDDRAILDITLVTSYFNFVNRMVLALGVQLENEFVDGYKY